MQRFDKVVLAGVVAVALGCGPTLALTPRQDGSPWIELTSDHFTLWTNTEPDRGRELIRKLERFRQIALGAVFADRTAAERHVVVALRDSDELRALWSPPRATSFTDVADGPLPSFAVFAEHSHDGDEDASIAHELTHLISGRVIRSQPRWVAEGMAQYFETVDLEPDNPVARLGTAPSQGGRPARRGPLLPIADLLTWQHKPTSEAREYSTSWALFTFLISAHRTEFLQYLQLLDEPRAPYESTAARGARIWSAAFPTLPLSSADRALTQWLVSGRHIVTNVNVQLRTWPVTERALSDADVYAICGRLYVARSRIEPAREAVTAALAAEPTHVLAWLVRLALDENAITLDEGRAVARAHSHDWRAWLVAAHALDRSPGEAAELQAAIGHACRLGGASATRGTRWSCARAPTTQSSNQPSVPRQP